MAYNLFLDNIKIGTTKLENGDPPMGVVFGVLQFETENINYDYLKEYCERNKIQLASDYPEDKIIATRTIDGLKVINEKGLEIKGIGNQITGMDNEEYEIQLEGVPYPLFQKEFPHHVLSYENKFKNS